MDELWGVRAWECDEDIEQRGIGVNYHRATRILGSSLAIIGGIGFVVGLVVWAPIVMNLSAWGSSCVTSILFMWVGYSLRRHTTWYAWRTYMTQTFNLLLKTACIAVLVYATLDGSPDRLELYIGLVGISFGCLAYLGWAGRHKVVAGLLLVIPSLAIINLLFPTIGRIPEALQLYITLQMIIGTFVFLNPLNLIYAVAAIAFVVWLVISVKHSRG